MATPTAVLQRSGQLVADAASTWFTGVPVSRSGTTAAETALESVDVPTRTPNLKFMPLRVCLEIIGVRCYTRRQVKLHKRRLCWWARFPYFMGVVIGILMEVSTIAWLFDSFSSHMPAWQVIASVLMTMIGYPAFSVFMLWQFQRTTTEWIQYKLDKSMVYGDAITFGGELPDKVREQAEWIKMLLPGVKLSVDCFFIRKAPWDPILYVTYRQLPRRPTHNVLIAVGRWLKDVVFPRPAIQTVAVAIWWEAP